MEYFQHEQYGLCVRLENTPEMRAFSDKLERWREQLRIAEEIRLTSVLLELAPMEVAYMDTIAIQGETRRWYRRTWAKWLSVSFCQGMFGTRWRWLFFSGPSNTWNYPEASNLPEHLRHFGKHF